MDYDDLMDVFRTRRSIRQYKSDPVSDDMVDKVIEAARWAPSGFNSQPWEFVVVREKGIKDRIVRFVNEYRESHYALMEKNREDWQKNPFTVRRGGETDWSHAPVFILIFGDTRAKAGLPMTVRMHKPKCESIFISSLACAFTYMLLASTTLGLAGQWVSAVQVPLVHSRVRRLLRIPEPLEIYDMLVLGYPAMKPRGKYLRPRDEITHYEDCGPDDFRSDEEVRDFVRRTRSWAVATINRGVDKTTPRRTL